MRYRLLGPIEVIGEDGQAVALTGEKERALLATLALGANQTVSANRLVDTLWGEDPPATAANTLQVHVSKLRKKLAAAGAPEAVASVSGGYLLRAGAEEIDVSSFEELVREAAGEPAGESARLGEALALWRGPALADVGAEALAGDRTRLEELRMLATERRIEAELALGRHSEVIAELEALVRHQPLREGPRRQLMVALYRAGRQADALATYRQARESLAEELGIDPGPELQALELAILRQDPELATSVTTVIPSPAPGPPSGTLTLLMSDIEGSTGFWEEHPAEMARALRRHDALLHGATEDHDGYVFKTAGDAFCAAFATAPAAAEAAAAAQRAVADEEWPAPIELRVRMGLHTGHCEERDGTYFGPAVNRVARLVAVAHGGQVVVSQVAAELLADAPQTRLPMRDLGVHRLKDLGRPEHIHQIVIPGLDAEFPPLRSLDNPDLDNNLPVQLTTFVGRQREVKEIDALVDLSRLVTLTGAGGAGKTRLALAVAAELLDGSGDGVWFVDLAPLVEPDLVPGAVAGALGVRAEPGRPVADTLIDALGGRRLLIVLDNCEHLIDACVKLVDQLVRSCANVHILATSREALGLGGERIYRVPPLGLPDPNVPGVSEAVALFVERAQDQRPDFVLDDENAPIVGELCRRLDGMPLAIELACARLRSMSLEDIEARLDERFRLLTGGSRGALPRQQTLRALIDWSYDLLTEPERVVLCRLSVFAGGWDLHAAETVCGDARVEDVEIDDLLSSLVDKSLVQVDYIGGGVRYRLLETVRHYAAEKLALLGDETVTAIRATHARVFLELVELANPKLQTNEQIVWLDQLDLEQENIRAAIEFFLSQAEMGTETLRILAAASDAWRIRMQNDVTHLLESALQHTGTQGRSALRARVLGALGDLSDVDSGTPYFRDALHLARSLDDRPLVAEFLMGLGWAEFVAGNPSAFCDLTEEAVTLARAIGSDHLLARALERRANAIEVEDPHTARHLYEEALHKFCALGDRRWEATTLCNLATCDLYHDQLESARNSYERALAVLDELGDRRRKATVLENFALAEMKSGNVASAAAALRQSLRLADGIGTRRGLAHSLLCSSACVAATHRYVEAATIMGCADHLFAQIGAAPEPLEAGVRAQCLAELKAELGGVFEDSYHAGCELTADVAASYALRLLETLTL